MREGKVFIPSAAVRLEGLLSNQKSLSIKGGIILCHPYPQYGGDMDNPIISIAAEVALEEGFSSLRFNFRGVGERKIASPHLLHGSSNLNQREIFIPPLICSRKNLEVTIIKFIFLEIYTLRVYILLVRGCKYEHQKNI